MLVDIMEVGVVTHAVIRVLSLHFKLYMDRVKNVARMSEVINVY